jgi:hypothetical protein
MKELSIADLIALSKYCNNTLESNAIKDSEVINYLFEIGDACNKELVERMSIIYQSLHNTSTT